MDEFLKSTHDKFEPDMARSGSVNMTIQEHWRNRALPHFSGIIAGNGMMVAMGEQTFFVDGKIRQHLYPICETSIDSFLGFGNGFVDVAFDDRRAPVPGTDCFALGGEGETGNQGLSRW